MIEHNIDTSAIQEDLQSRIARQFFVLDDELQAKGHLAVARGCVNAMLTGKLVLDSRTPPAKHEWQSGGTRNPFGSRRKLNASREKQVWIGTSTYTDEKGRVKTHGHTQSVGANIIKRAARNLAHNLEDIRQASGKRLSKKQRNSRSRDLLLLNIAQREAEAQA